MSQRTRFHSKFAEVNSPRDIQPFINELISLKLAIPKLTPECNIRVCMCCENFKSDDKHCIRIPHLLPFAAPTYNANSFIHSLVGNFFVLSSDSESFVVSFIITSSVFSVPQDFCFFFLLFSLSLNSGSYFHPTEFQSV